ncbi:hypothetical protein YC2023_025745 [Brassica napus]
MELRRKKEMTKVRYEFIHHHHDTDTAMIFNISSDGDNYLIHTTWAQISDSLSD